MQSGYYLGFDYGTRSIGVACGQTRTCKARPLTAIKAKDGIPSWPLIEALIREWQPKGLVVGLPLNMDGSEQEITTRAKKFSRRLHGRFALPVYTVDERLTTVEARQQLFDDGGFQNLSKENIDSAAAAILLEDWLNGC